MLNISKGRGAVLIIAILAIIYLTFDYLSNYQNLPKTHISLQFHKDMVAKRPISKNSIFFLETSCIKTKNTKGNVKLNSRQACAIYSTAKYNPHRPVILYHSCPLKDDFYSSSSKFVQKLLELPNFNIFDQNIENLYNNTPLEDLFKGKLSYSQYPIEHNADLLRILIIYTYGGTYLDLDVVSLRSMDELGENFIGVQESEQLGTGLFHFSSSGSGHEYLGIILKKLASEYDEYSWSSNGPILASNVLIEFCNISSIFNVEDVVHLKKCNITTLPPKMIYPIPYPQWELYFDPNQYEEVKRKISSAVLIHVWNHLSSKKIITCGSQQPYGKLAEQHCGPIYESSGNYF